MDSDNILDKALKDLEDGGEFPKTESFNRSK